MDTQTTTAVPGAGEVARFSTRHLTFLLPLVAIHAACVLIFVVGFSGVAAAVFVITALAQMFGITVGYHRLLAHRSFHTSRPFQFVLALLGTLACQNGPLWWVGHHLHHHRSADQDEDIHSPRAGVFWSHMGWLFSPRIIPIREDLVGKLSRLPELQLLQRYCYLVTFGYALLLYLLGEIWRSLDSAAGVSGPQLVIWGSTVSTVCIYHLTFSIGSVCHLYGTRPFATPDDSRNNLIVSLLTFGEGWHNNHHYYPYSARMGLRCWELDMNYAILRLLAWFGIVWNLKLPPKWRIERRSRLLPNRSPRRKIDHPVTA